MRLLRKCWHLLIAVAMGAAAVVGFSSAASADETVCGPWHSQQDLADTVGQWCRSTFLDPPPIGGYLSRAQLMAAADLYLSEGFSRQWLWYAPPTPLHFDSGSAQEWTACPPGPPYGQACPVGARLTHGSILHDFGGNAVDLDTFAYGGRFITRVCGNFGYPLPAAADPVPVITRHKYDDLNGNHQQDPGEPGLAGWTFELIRDSSMFNDQPTGVVAATAVSRPDGGFTFPLNGIGPGNYMVREVPQNDWVSTTGLEKPVTVLDGQGDSTVTDLWFGNRSQAITATGTTISPIEGTSFTGTVATFTDPDAAATAAEYAATIDWGDGTPTSPGTISGPTGGPFTVTGSHTYTDESHATVTVTIRDIDNAANGAAVTTGATVGDAPLAAGTPLTVTPVEGNAFSGVVGTFTDANPSGPLTDFTATIDWGDGTPTSPGTITGPTGGPFIVTGSHTYADEGSYPLTITGADEGGATTTISGTAAVADAALTATGYPGLLSTNPVTGIAVATFTDANPSGPITDFTATIDWGDGTPTSPGTITGPTGGPFTVTGSHTYAALGPETITVHIVDDGSATATATATSHLIVFAYPDGGNFVVGGASTATGSQVTFWGSQWATDNPLSVTAPDAFKGFEDNPTLPTCGGAWTSLPGNSSNPPGTIPTYIALIVSSHIDKDGPSISGDVQHIVIVRTDPGYLDDPGHPGTGEIVATLC